MTNPQPFPNRAVAFYRSSDQITTADTGLYDNTNTAHCHRDRIWILQPFQPALLKYHTTNEEEQFIIMLYAVHEKTCMP